MSREFVTEEEVDKALDFLRDNSSAAAQAKATRIYLEEYRKSLKAMVMKEHASLPIGAQEREAYASEEYLKHLGALKDAVFEDERLRFLMKAAEAKIEAWRSQSANYRAMKV